MSQARGDDGTFVEETSVEEVFEELKSANEPLTATEIADRLGISTRSALDKLNALNERNPIVYRKQVGAKAVIWFIRHGAVHEQAFEAFCDRLTDECGGEIDRIFLYGSVARGEAHEHSDVDVLIVVSDESEREPSDREDESVREIVRDHASSIAFDVMIEYDVCISKTLETKQVFDQEDNSRFLTNVKREGQEYGRN